MPCWHEEPVAQAHEGSNTILQDTIYRYLGHSRRVLGHLILWRAISLLQVHRVFSNWSNVRRPAIGQQLPTLSCEWWLLLWWSRWWQSWCECSGGGGGSGSGGGRGADCGGGFRCGGFGRRSLHWSKIGGTISSSVSISTHPYMQPLCLSSQRQQ